MELLHHLCISFLLLLFPYLFASHIRRKFAKLPPTIFPSIPILGHLYLLKPPLYRTFAKISAQYGPIILFQLGFRRVLIVSSPSLVEECFTKNDTVFANRPRMLFGKIIGVNYTSIAWSPYNDNWRNLRRIASTEILSVHRLNEFQDIRSEEGKFLIGKLMSNCLNNNNNNNTYSLVNMKLVFYELMLNVMMRMVSGKRYFGGENVEFEKEGKRFKEILDESFELASGSNVSDYLPFLKWLFGVDGLEKKLIELQKKRDVLCQGLIEQVRKSKGSDVGNNNKKTMIEMLLSRQEIEPEYYTDAMIRNFVLALLAAGTDTTAGTMEWTMSLLLNHPKILEKARNEIDSVIGTDRLVNESDIENLPYLRCIINETQRLYPAGPLLGLHEASNDCVVGGYNIPRGTMLIVNQWGIHHDPKVWKDPERFDPERFEGLQGNRDGFKLMPFGSGRRSCPGEGLAVRMLGMTLGSIIQCFDWERIGEHLVDMSEGHGLTMPKAIPLIAKCKPRPKMHNLLSQI